MIPCSRPVTGCPDCGDALIHQSNRQEHESSSEFGQYMHDRGEMDSRWRQMYWLDVDGIVYKKRTKVLRIIEHKNRSGDIRDSQETVLPLLAKSVQLLIATQVIHPQSGVFVAYSDHPHDSALVQRVDGWSPRPKDRWTRVELRGSQWDDFLLGELMGSSGSEAA